MSYLVLFILSRHLSQTGLFSQSGGFVSVINVLPFPGSSLVDILVVENMFLQLLSTYFGEIFFGKIVNYYNHVSIFIARASAAHTGSVALNMSDDDRAAKAARAKALVRLFLSEIQPLTLLCTAQQKEAAKETGNRRGPVNDTNAWLAAGQGYFPSPCGLFRRCEG
jgi:hypothetical protein